MGKKKIKSGISELVGAPQQETQDRYGSLGWRDLLEKAGEAAGEYDFDLAWDLYRLAALAGKGKWDSVQPLARFLVEDYARFDAALELLEGRHWDDEAESVRLLAQTHYHLGAKDQALELYEEVAGKLQDSRMWLRIGTLRQEKGDHDAAVEAFDRALNLESVLLDAQNRRKTSVELLTTQAQPRLDAIRGALDRGELDEARIQLDSFRYWRPESLGKLRKELETRLKSRRLEDALDRAVSIEGAGDQEKTIAAYQEVLRIDAGCELALQKLEELRKKQAGKRVEECLTRARDMLARGELAASVEQYFRSLLQAREEGLTVPASPVPQFQLVQDFHRETGRQVTQTQAEALVRLLEVEDAVDQGELDLMTRHQRSLESALGAFSRLDDLRERYQLIRQTRERNRGEALVEEARTLEREGRQADALERYRQALQLLPDDLRVPLAVERLEAALAERAELDAAWAHARRLLEQEAWFELIRVLKDNPKLVREKPEVSGWRMRAAGALSRQYPFTMVRTPRSSGVRPYFSSKDQCISGLDPSKARLMHDPDNDRVLMLHERTLAAIDLKTCQLDWTATLPESLAHDPESLSPVFLHSPGPDGDLFCTINRKEDRLVLFGLNRGNFEVRSVLKPSLFLRDSREKHLANFILDGVHSQLNILEVPAGKSGPTRFLGISLDSGKPVFENEQSYGLYHFSRLPWEQGQYRVNRILDVQAYRRPGFFTWAVIDEKGRIKDKFYVPPEELDGAFIEGITWLEKSLRNQRYYMFARFIEPYTGQVVNFPPAFVAMNQKGDLYYAVADGAAVLREKAELIGSLFLAAGKQDDILIIPYKKSTRVYLGRYRAEDLSSMGGVRMEPDVTHVRILASRDKSRTWVYSRFDADGLFSIRGFDAESGELGA